MLKKVELENCLRVMSYEVHKDESVVKDLLTDISLIKYCEPFKAELYDNLVEKQNKEGQEAVIRYYIRKLYGISDFLKDHYALLFTGSLNSMYGDITHTRKGGKKTIKTRLNEIGKYVVKCRWLYIFYFQAIENACKDYNMEFLAICADMEVDLTHYDVSPFKREAVLPRKTKELSNKNQRSLPATFKEIFVEADYHKFLEPLCSMKMPLLKRNKDGNYTFLRGKAAICRYFFHDLKDSALKKGVTQVGISNVLYKSLNFNQMPVRSSYGRTFIYEDLKKYISHKN